MKRKAYLSAVIGLLATFGVIGGSIGIVDTAEASFSRSHSHSLAGRSFQVNVKNLDDGTSVPNCYTFEEGGTWVDPAFLGGGLPVFLGTWVQHTGGFFTRYTAFAKSPEIPDFAVPPLRLIQNGTVVRSFRKGKLWLRAYSTVMLDLPGVDVVVGNFLSTGHSVDSCD